MASPSSIDPDRHPGAAVAGRLRRWRARAEARVRETFADRRRRWRLIRTSAFWALFAAAVGVFFALFSWDWFRGPLAGYLSARTGRQVQIEGHLHVHPFSWSPWASVDGVKIANPAWLGGGKGQMADLGRTTVQLRLLPLIEGRLELPLVDIEHPALALYADKTGRNNWTFGKGSGKGAKLPPIQHFVLNDGHIHVQDVQRRLSFTGVVTTTENAGAASAAAFRLDGAGTLNAAPFRAHVTGGPLVHVQK
ncbi:MAG TPA: AsmA family protein, partial [Caulobacteraceae bacterium]|nr:AsmA family protein [Caulobacteraceae bacterium]